MSHTVHLKILEARNVKAADPNGFSDPYAKIVIHDKKDIKTKIVKKTLNPKWDETFHIDGVPDRGSFVIQLFDWDLVGTDDFLGSVAINYNAAVFNKAKERWTTLSDEEGPQGEIHYVLQVLPKGYKADLENVVVSHSRLSFAPEVKEGSAQLVVEVVKASNLPAKDLNGSSDPYCVLKVGKIEYKTNIIEHSLNPMWNEEFYFELAAAVNNITVELFDWDRLSAHDRMGVVVIDMKTLYDERPHAKSYEIVASKKEKVSGEIFLRLQYTSPQNAQMNHIIAKRDYNRLVQSVVIRDVGLIVNLLHLYETQELAKSIVNIFSSENRMMNFFRECFSREVKNTLNENTLFRTDCASTKTATAYLKYVDAHVGYLQRVMVPLITLVQKDPLSYETEKKKDESEANRKVREKNLLAMTQKFLDTIIATQHSFPPQFSELLYCLRSAVAPSFPGSELKAVNGILFLRFICPSIFSPEGFGLLPTPPKPEFRRALTLIAKNLQTIVNSGQFGSSKEHSKANLVASMNSDGLHEFLDVVSRKPAGEVKDGFDHKEEEKIKFMELIVKNLRGNFEKLQELVYTDPRLSADPALAAELKLQVDEIAPILGE